MTFRSTTLLVVAALAWHTHAYGQSQRDLPPPAARDSLDFHSFLQSAIKYEPILYDSALYFAQKALELATERQEKRWLLRAVGLIGQIRLNMGDESTALQFYFQSANLSAQLADNSQLGKSFYQIGAINEHAGNVTEAQGYFVEALAAFRAIDNKLEMANTFNALGHLNQSIGNIDEATENYRQALALARQANDSAVLALILSSLGDLAVRQRQFQGALTNYFEALKFSQQTNDSYLISNVLINLSRLYLVRGQPKPGLVYAQRALAASQKLKSVRALANLAKANLALADGYFAIGETGKAFASQKSAIDLRDSLQRLRNAEEVAKVNAGFQVERRQREMEKLQLRERESLARQNLNRQLFTAGIIFLLLFSLLLVAHNQRKLKTNRVLARKNAALVAQKQQINAQTSQMRAVNQQVELSNQVLAQALAEISRKNEELHRYADELDEKVQSRTAALLNQNEKLVEYGFVNAHKLRAPVASILGLTRLLMMTPLQQHEFELVAALDQTTKQLDVIVHEIQAILQSAEYREDRGGDPAQDDVKFSATNTDTANDTRNG